MGVCAFQADQGRDENMKTNEEIAKEVWRDWNTYLYEIPQPDESNMGDIADWARKEYVRELLGLFSCNFCYKWFESPIELAEHLAENHETEITFESHYTGYSEYTNAYNIDNRVYDSSEEKVTE